MQVILHRSEGVNRTRTRRQSPAHAALTGERRQGRVEWDCCTRSNASLVSTPVAPGRKPGSRTGCAVPIAVGAASSLSATFADGTPSAINGCFRTGKATSTTEPRRARRASGPAQARQSHALLLKLPEPRGAKPRAAPRRQMPPSTGASPCSANPSTRSAAVASTSAIDVERMTKLAPTRPSRKKG